MKTLEIKPSRFIGTLEQLLHGCRQFVLWGLPFSWVTNATLASCYSCHEGQPPLFGRERKISVISFLFSVFSFTLICFRFIGLIRLANWKLVNLKPITDNREPITGFSFANKKRGRKVRMMSNQHGAYAAGHTHPTMLGTTGCQAARRS